MRMALITQELPEILQHKDVKMCTIKTPSRNENIIENELGQLQSVPIENSMTKAAIKDPRERLIAAMLLSANELTTSITRFTGNDEITTMDINILSNALSILQKSFFDSSQTNIQINNTTNMLTQFRESLKP